MLLMQEAPNATFSKAEAASVFARIGRLASLAFPLGVR
jgi:hypothetical protein